MPRNEHLVDPEAAPPPKRKRRFGNDNVERALLLASLVLLGMAIKFSLLGGHVWLGRGKGASMEVVEAELASEVEPETYDSSVELRIPLAERVGLQLKPFVVVLRGPWGFGSVEMDKMVLALGPPIHRGSGYLVYELAEGKIRLGLLFNASRLDTLYLTPTPDREKPSVWGLTPRQITGESLQFEPPAGSPKDPCGRRVAPARGLSYVTCEEGDPSIPAVYIQRITPEFRNPPPLRGITGPSLEPAEPWTPQEYERLLAHYQESSRLKQRALSAEHASLQYWKFETARLLVEAGRKKEAAKSMREAIDALSTTLGRNHEDLVAMRLWLPKSR
jgi:hypothetical protein